MDIKLLKREIRTYNIVALAFARGIGGTHERRCLWDLCGKSVLQWSFEAVKKSKYIEKIVLGTEDFEIAHFAEQLGITVILRPLEDALDFPRDYTSGMHKRLKPRSLIHGKLISWANRRKYVLDYLKESNGYIPDLIFGWAPIMPLATTETANRVIEAFFKDPEASRSQSVYAVEPKLFTINPVTQRLFPIFIDSLQSLDRQLYPPTFKGGPFSLRGLPTIGTGKTAHVIVDEAEGIHIHTKKDLEFAKFEMKKKLKGGENV